MKKLIYEHMFMHVYVYGPVGKVHPFYKMFEPFYKLVEPNYQKVEELPFYQMVAIL